MKSKRVFLVLTCVATLAVAGLAWWWHTSGAKLEVVEASLPALPDLNAAPATMREKILAADARARSRTTAEKSIVELAQLYHANGFLEEAMIAYSGLEQLQPKEARWPHLHATILAGYGDAEPALELWRRVAQLAPEYVPAKLRTGDTLLKANRPDEAAEAYSAVLALDPAQAHALFGLARVDFEAERWDQARKRLEEVVRMTNYQLGYDLIVTLYERLGMQDRARSIRGAAAASGAYRDPADPWLDGLIEYCYDPFRLSLNAGVVARLGDPATAQRLLERAVEIAPNDVAPRFQLGTLAVEQGNIQLATEQLERCTTLAPEFADGWAHLSALQAQQGNLVLAERTLATGLKNCPDSPGLHLMRARNLRRAGRLEEAINEYRISARLRPNEPEAFLEMGNTYIAMNREGDGIAQIQAALKAEPGNPTALSILTFHAITRGSEDEARRWMEQIEQQPRIPRETVTALTKAYREKYGRAWR